MAETNTRTAFRKYFRRRVPAVAAGAIVAFGIASPAALASPVQQQVPPGLWGDALRRLVESGPTTTNAIPQGRFLLGDVPADGRATPQPAEKQPAGTQPAQPQPRNKWVTGSHYEQTTAPSVLRAQGCDAGKQSINGLVVLAFGKPSYNGHTYGTILFSDRFVGNRSITYAMKSFARGYVSCLPEGSSAQITLARGTSNYGISVPNPNHAGRRWARETMVLAKWLRYHPAVGQHVRSAAGIDAEPAWDPSFHKTHAFFQGYRQAATGYLLYNFGSLDGGVGAIWNLRQAFYVAGGMKYARVVPEIYFPQMVHQWAQLARMAERTFHRSVQFAGVMTQRAPGCGRHVCGFGPREAHNRLKHALALVDATRPLSRHLASVTNIN